MKIQILGSGCMKCEELFQNAKQAVAEIDPHIEIEKISDPVQIVSFGVLLTPALVVNGVVKSVGKVISADEIKSFL